MARSKLILFSILDWCYFSNFTKYTLSIFHWRFGKKCRKKCMDRRFKNNQWFVKGSTDRPTSTWFVTFDNERFGNPRIRRITGLTVQGWRLAFGKQVNQIIGIITRIRFKYIRTGRGSPDDLWCKGFGFILWMHWHNNVRWALIKW